MIIKVVRQEKFLVSFYNKTNLINPFQFLLVIDYTSQIKFSFDSDDHNENVNKESLTKCYYVNLPSFVRKETSVFRAQTLKIIQGK